MNRREAISAVAWLMGGTLISADLLVSCTSRKLEVGDLFQQEQVALLNEVGDTILPATSTPGAKAANVGEFMAVMVRDCYAPEDQQIFVEGITKLNEASDNEFGKNFMELNPQQRTTLVRALDAEQQEQMRTKEEGAPNHYFRMIKELTLLGFFSSEVGATQALRFEAVPGRYDGCMPYKKGDRAWAVS
ncbi:gluconate 2-dehydrogenase subunit 3 family protein [Pontibacter diazotrophicus]|uniref:Gluconate 2-dehydrogenase subunit 3 family protein n=1 Tax=Pontibacter diazotrophicus TaxID=1400979 RepID=A0A3D8LG64_9BACT|nr:gluconate 2-dehydrogenase subunit 3 family protein [Pontibacter diazotrophicus]RDV16388.1 gluconate 2-dehydrogenase subunit 3 family protein [Pontibacter diazotrophicus]